MCLIRMKYYLRNPLLIFTQTTISDANSSTHISEVNFAYDRGYSRLY